MWRGCIAAAVLWLAAGPEAPALDLLVVRHAETLANVQDDYSVFNQRHFSALGEQQVSNLTAALAGRRFDAILVSPAYRAQRTILPLLQQQGAVAEIWPELDECCWQKGDERGASDTFATGPQVLVEQEMRPYFLVRQGSDGMVGGMESRTDGIVRIKRAAALVKERFGGTAQTVLVVMHQHSGSRLVESLLDQAPEGRYRLANASVTWLRADGGRFRIEAENLVPAEAATRLSPPVPAR
jgi:broad specificity phosphatase PhoE